MYHRSLTIIEPVVIRSVALTCILACGAKVEKTHVGNASSTAGGGGSDRTGASSGGGTNDDGGSGGYGTSAGASSGSGADAGGATTRSASMSSTAAGGVNGSSGSDVTGTSDTSGIGGSAGEGPASTTGVGGVGGGGAGGTAGWSGAVETLGAPCSTPGKLACAGNYQKLSLVCDGDGEWEVNETCGVDEFCDTLLGNNAGLCRSSSVECAGRDPAERYCTGRDVAWCWPDGLDEAVAEVCPAGCENGECHEGREPCPDGYAWLSCDPECAPSTNCSATTFVPLVIDDVDSAFIVRTAEAANSRGYCVESRVGYDFELNVPLDAFWVRVSVAAPWQVGVPATSNQWPCNMVMSSCAVGSFPSSAPTLFAVTTEDLNAAPANVTVEISDEAVTCPP